MTSPHFPTRPKSVRDVDSSNNIKISIPLNLQREYIVTEEEW